MGGLRVEIACMRCAHRHAIWLRRQLLMQLVATICNQNLVKHGKLFLDPVRCAFAQEGAEPFLTFFADTDIGDAAGRVIDDRLVNAFLADGKDQFLGSVHRLGTVATQGLDETVTGFIK
eukprot:Anaeramoba_flamelloidesc42580_g1_i6.p3 GENE.c42580_g1_i6~~c42580_g1_i6.p3  ORF type:complete len:119 (+),score=9.03 c42580_g1_i6:444-800(+)